MGLRERRTFRIPSHRYSRTLFVSGFRLFWVILIIWGELGTFFWSLSSCRWPVLDTSADQPTRVLLISDPQIRRPSVFQDQTTWRGSLRQLIFDLYLKKSWHVTTRLNPHHVIFLGDMLSSGKSVENEADYEQYAQKFRSTFAFKPKNSFHYVPGNNDVGMGVSNPLSNSVRSHYSRTFGHFNQEFVIHGHTFIGLDAPGLVDEDYQRAAKGVGYDEWNSPQEGPVSFVKNVATTARKPLILLSHIPLSRPDSASCGTLREKGTIRRGVGHGYQNTLGKQTTAFLLNTLQPNAIFSGDNRDYCEYTHTVAGTNPKIIREVTVKSFSMANHIRNPGFQLLSLIDPSTSTTQESFADKHCLFPDQYGIYSSLYLPCSLFTVLMLLVFNILGARQSRALKVEPLPLSPYTSNNESGRDTPSFQPESAIWTPWTPTVPVSPRGTVPPFLRAPNGRVGSTLRAASSPATPRGSPLLTPMLFTPEDEEEFMSPTQYATHRDRHWHDEGWSTEHQGDGMECVTAQRSYFTSAPGLKSGGRRRWSWSWSFVLKGRRRRMTIRAPSLPWNSITEMGGLLRQEGRNALTRPNGVLKGTAIDVLGVLSVAILLWGVIAWFTF